MAFRALVPSQAPTLAVDLEMHHVYTPEQEENGKTVARIVVSEAVTGQ